MWQNRIIKCVRVVDYKVWQQWITNCVGCWIKKVAKWITKCVRDYKVWQSGLQSTPGITKCGVITK